MKHRPSGESGRAIERAEQTRVEQAVQQVVMDLEKRGKEMRIKLSSVERVEMSPEQREAYRRFYEATKGLFEKNDASRHNGVEVIQVGLPDDHSLEGRPVIGVTRRLGSSFSEIPKDVPVAEWGDYISDFGAIGKKAEPNAHVSLTEAHLPFRAEYDYNSDGSVSRGLFDLDSGELIDFEPLAPISEVENLSTVLPECVDIHRGSIGSIESGTGIVGGLGSVEESGSSIAAPE